MTSVRASRLHGSGALEGVCDPPLHVLVVEDEEAHVELVRRAFATQAERFQVTSVGTVADARTQIAQLQPDFAIVDFLLPDGRGTELLPGEGVAPSFPIVLMTSFGNEQVAVEAMKAGALDYVVKSAATLADMPHVAERTLREWDHLIERRRADEDKSRLLDRIQRQNATLVRLATDPDLAAGNLDAALRTIAEEAGRTLGVDRVNICRISGDRSELCCDEAFQRSPARHMAGPTLPVDKLQRFFASLETDRVLAASDVMSDPRTAELVETCWEPGGIGAILAAPIRLRGKMIGLVCHDHVGPPREWAPDEVTFAGQVADLIAQAFLSGDLHRRADELAAIARVSREITSPPDLRQMLSLVAHQAADLARSDASGVFSCRPDGSLFVDYGYGVDGIFVTAVNEVGIQPGSGAIGQAVAGRQAVQIFDIRGELDYPYRQAVEAEGICSVLAVPMLLGDEVKGGIVLWHRELRHFSPEEVSFVQALAQQCVSAVQNASLFEELQQSHMELSGAYDTTLEGWARALELRDEETEGHTRRVTEVTLRLASRMGINSGELVHIRRGAILHDIGKMGIPDGLLLKTGPLTDQEWEVMRRHPVYAHRLLSPIDFLAPALDIPYCHHEKWDGSGYPRGLKGEEIPLAARVFTVVDVWDALLSNRPYRKAWAEDKVLEHLRQQAGAHFDPRVVEAFLRLLDERPT